MTQHVYGPVGSNMELFRCREPEVLLSGSAGTGKSRGCLEKVHAMACINPGSRHLLVRKTAVSLGSTALVTWRQFVAKEALESREVIYHGGSRQEQAGYRYANGSFVGVGGIDRPTRIMSSEYDTVYVQEATELTIDDWEMLGSRLRNGRMSFQQLLADCNPDAPHHWLKKRADAERTKLIYCRHEDNPRLYNVKTGEWTEFGKAYIERLDALTGVRKQRLRYGLWVSAEGLVYDGFDPAVHLHPGWFDESGQRVPPPRDWPRWLSIDFGYRNPFVCQWWTADPDGRLIMYREIYLTGTLVEDHAAVIRSFFDAKDEKGNYVEPPPAAIICDHDAEDRATLERKLGWSTTAATKNVSEGIQAVQERLKIRGDGTPGLYFVRDCLVSRDSALDAARRPMCTSEEILDYVWDQRITALTGLKETPVKENDHGMDATRYLVADHDLVGRPRARWI